MNDSSFYSAFLARLNNIEDRAQRVGITLTHICRDAGIARATPDRWRKNPPKSIKLMDDMERAVIAAEQKAEAEQETPDTQ